MQTATPARTINPTPTHLLLIGTETQCKPDEHIGTLMIQPRVKEVILRDNVTGLLLRNGSPANRNIRLSDIAGVSSTSSNMQIKSATAAGYIATGACIKPLPVLYGSS
jgi:hypothetical protein